MSLTDAQGRPLGGSISNIRPSSPFSAPVGAFMLHLLRELAYPDCTVGKLFVDGQWLWWTLEDTLRKGGVKIPGETCIPAGTYQIALTPSIRFQRVLPLLQNVPNFSGIRIHPGNIATDTQGCVLVGGGYDQRQKMLLHSRVAADAVQEAIAGAMAQGKQVWIEVVDPPDGHS